MTAENYPPLPEPVTYQIAEIKGCEDGDAIVGWRVEPSHGSYAASMRPKRTLFTSDQMRAYVDADRASRNAAGSGISDASALQALAALDELESSARGDEPFNHFAGPLVRQYIESTLAMSPATTQQVMLDFEQVGTAGPFPVIDGRVQLPTVTMMDLARMLKPTSDNLAKAATTQAQEAVSTDYDMIDRSLRNNLNALQALFRDAMDWGRSYGQRLNLTDMTLDDVSMGFAEKAAALAAPTQADSAPGDEAQVLAWIDSRLRGPVPRIRIQLMERGQYRLIDSVDALRAARAAMGGAKS